MIQPVDATPPVLVVALTSGTDVWVVCAGQAQVLEGRTHDEVLVSTALVSITPRRLSG